MIPEDWDKLDLRVRGDSRQRYGYKDPDRTVIVSDVGEIFTRNYPYRDHLRVLINKKSLGIAINYCKGLLLSDEPPLRLPLWNVNEYLRFDLKSPDINRVVPDFYADYNEYKVI